MRVRVEGLCKSYGALSVLQDISIELEPGEMLVLLGSSGSGKTTLLRCISGLEIPTAGSIWIDDDLVFSSDKSINVPVEKRRLGMVFQNYALWPHMSALENVMFPLLCAGFARGDARKRGEERLGAVGLAGREDAYPSQMSGGQQQRVALARALVGESRLILFDEPLSNLDARVRDDMRSEIKKLHAELGFNGLYVTHDQIEASALADRIAVVTKGIVAQHDTPRAIYDNPASRFVANFMGFVNEIRGTATDFSDGFQKMTTPLGILRARSNSAIVPGTDLVMAFRPETSAIKASAGENAVSGKVLDSMFFASHAEHVVDVAGNVIKIHDASGRSLSPNDTVTITIAPEKAFAFVVADHASGGRA